MAKSTRNAAKHSGKTIADYFSRKPAQSKSSQSSTDKPTSATASSSRADHQKTVAPSSFESSLPSTTSKQADHSTVSRVKALQEPITSQIKEPRRSRSPTRSSTPEDRYSNSPSRIVKAMSPMRPSEKRKVKFGIDVDTEPAKSVLYMAKGGSVRPDCVSSDSTATTLPTPLSPRGNLAPDRRDAREKETRGNGNLTPDRRDARKKLRFSSPESELDEVPGSQSDEAEMMPLVAASRNETSPNETIVQATSFDSESPDISMDVDVFYTPKASVVDTSNDLSEFSHMFREPLTPPPTCPAQNLTIETSVLDQATKTAQVIANIRAKAEAQAAANSSPENAPIHFKEELSDSESEEELFTPLKRSNKGKEKSPAAEASNRSRYNLRGPAALVPSSRRASVSPIRGMQTKKLGSKKKKANPLDALLKEKQKDNRRGGGAEALERAEKALAGKDKLLSEMDEEDDHKWRDENAAREAVQQHAERMHHHSSSPAKEVDVEEIDLDETLGHRLFGDEKSEAIRSNITREREQRDAARLRESSVGIPLWIKHGNTDHFMDEARPSFDFGDIDQCPILCMLKRAIDHDTAQLILLLNAGVLCRVELGNHPGVIEYFCHLALSADGDERGRVAYHALLNRWNSLTASTPGITLRTCIDAVVQIGADPDRIGLSGVQPAIVNPIRPFEREALLYRLVSLVTLSARSQLLKPEDIPNIILILLAISLDPSTSKMLETDIAVALDTMCHSIADGDSVSPKFEAAICTKILEYISNFDPVNKSFVISLIARGSGRSTRIARWVARSVLLGQKSACQEKYCHLPSIEELSICLISTSLKCTAFRVGQETDYIDMGFYTSILATALSDFPAYVKKEIMASKSAKLESPNKLDKQETGSEYIRSCIDSIYSKIGDTQGSHLDRTRAKAALKNLSLRMHYQRIAISKSGQNNGRPKSIQQYFKPKG